MALIGQILQGISGLGILICFVLVVVQMFNRGETTMGIVSIVLLFCCGIGELIVFIYGWIKSRDWGITNLMLIWTVLWVLGIVGLVLNPVDYSAIQAQLQGLPGR
jgi:hypothetical protein